MLWDVPETAFGNKYIIITQISPCFILHPFCKKLLMEPFQHNRLKAV